MWLIFEGKQRNDEFRKHCGRLKKNDIIFGSNSHLKKGVESIIQSEVSPKEKTNIVH